MRSHWKPVEGSWEIKIKHLESSAVGWRGLCAWAMGGRLCLKVAQLGSADPSSVWKKKTLISAHQETPAATEKVLLQLLLSPQYLETCKLYLYPFVKMKDLLHLSFPYLFAFNI